MTNENEIARILARVEHALTYLDGRVPSGEEDERNAVSDLIANLAIYCHERDLPLAALVTRGLAHYAATYIEPLEDDEAYEWLKDELFPFTGEREFPEYVADQAIVLAGKSGRIESPEWGI